MAIRVENKAVTRRQFYGTLVGVMGFVEFAVASVGQDAAYRSRLEAFIFAAVIWALIELLRTR